MGEEIGGLKIQLEKTNAESAANLKLYHHVRNNTITNTSEFSIFLCRPTLNCILQKRNCT